MNTIDIVTRESVKCRKIANLAREYIEDFLNIKVRSVNYLEDGSAEVCIMKGITDREHTCISSALMGMCLMYAEEHNMNTKEYWDVQPCVSAYKNNIAIFYHIFTDETIKMAEALGMN